MYGLSFVGGGGSIPHVLEERELVGNKNIEGLLVIERWFKIKMVAETDQQN